jgi:hypothetical protein
MRPLLICLVTIVATLAGTASSLARHHHEARNYSSYPACVCHFGYGSSGCAPDVACASEGGKCAEACFIQNAQDYIDR